MTSSVSCTSRATRTGRNPSQAGSGGRAAGVMRVIGAVDEVAERALPARAQRGDAQQPAHRVRRRRRAGRAGRRSSATLICSGRGADLDDVVARLHATFPQDPEVEARPVVGHEQRGHTRLVQAQPDPVAGDARLGDLELGVADAVAVADAHLVVGQPVDGEVLAEDARSVRSVRPRCSASARRTRAW